MRRFNLSEWAITHRPLVLFMIILLGAAGIYSYLNLGRAEDPSFTIKTMVVHATWPGATATEMQAQVTDKIEKKLQELPYPRPHRELFAAGRDLHPRHSHRQDPARQGEGAVVPGSQEGRRHPARAAGGHHRSRFQRRIRRRLFRALHAHRRRPEPRRAQSARRGHPPAAAARSRRQQGRHHRRAAGEDLHRVQPRQARHPRAHAAADLRQRRQAERRHLRRLGRHLGRPHQSAGDRRLLRRGGDRRRAGPGERADLPARRHCDGQARLRGPADLHGARGRQAGARPRRVDAGRRQYRHARREPQTRDERHHQRASGRDRGHADRRSAPHRRGIGLGVRQDLCRGARHRAGRELPVARLAHRHRGGAVGAAGAGDRAAGDVRDRARSPPHHARRADHRARAAGRRRHHRHRDDGGEDGAGLGPGARRDLCLDLDRLSDADRHAGDRGGLPAGRLRQVERRRICRRHFLDRRPRADRLLGGRGAVHALSRPEALAQSRQARRAAKIPTRSTTPAPIARCAA